MALHLWLSSSPTGVTRGLTCHATHRLGTRRHDGVLSLPKDHHGRAFRQVELQPLRCARHQTARVPSARRGDVLAAGLASPRHDVLQSNNILHHPQSGCDAGSQRGPAPRGKGLKALSTPGRPLLDVATPCSCGCRTGEGAPHPDETRLMAALPLQGTRRPTDQLLYPLGTPERPSLCASHPQRRELPHVELRVFHRATPGVDRTRLVKQVRQRRRFEPEISVTADAFSREGQDIAVQVAHEWIGSTKALLCQRAWVPQRFPPAVMAHWRPGEKTERGALRRDGTRGEGCYHRHGAHGASEPTRVLAGLGDPVT
jgi:hypothetical protein